MKMDIIDEKDNKLFKRRDLTVGINHDGSATISKAELIKNLASSKGVDASQVVIDYIFTEKGIPKSVAKVKILDEKPPAKEEPKKEEGKKDEAQADKGA